MADLDEIMITLKEYKKFGARKTAFLVLLDFGEGEPLWRV